MRICDEISSGVNLREIKKPSKLGTSRKYASVSDLSPPVPLRSSSISLEGKTQSSPPKEKGGAAQVDDIFSKENEEFWDIYHQFDEHLKTTYPSKQNPNSRRNRLPSDTQSLPPEPLDIQLSDVESVCSDVPTSPRHQTARELHAMMSGPRSHQGFHRPYRRQEPLRVNLRDMSDLSGSNTSLSSACSSNCFSPLPFGGAYSSLPNVHSDSSTTASGRSTPSSMCADSLTVIRQQMASALKRLKQLEDQVKLIPTLHVKINVLKEEKRLLKMQIQKREESEQSRDAKMQLDAKETIQRRERELQMREAECQQKEQTIRRKEMDLNRWKTDLVKQEAELKQRESELSKREVDFQKTLETQRREFYSDLVTSNVTNSSDHHRPNTLEELAEKLNKLKRTPPPVAPKPQMKTPLQKAVVQPYVHTRTIGVNVDTIKCDVKDVGVSVNAGMSFQPINVTMWKPNSMSELPVCTATQTDSEDTSDISAEATITFSDESILQASPGTGSVSQNVETQTIHWEEKPEVSSMETSTQTMPERAPLIKSRNWETQTEGLSNELLDAVVQTETEPVKITYDRGTFTLLEVSDRSTATDKRAERDVYSRGTVTDIVQRRHMAVNTDVVETLQEIKPLILSEDSETTSSQMVRTETMDAWTKMENPLPKDAFTETDKTILRDIGALMNAATETVCDTVDKETSVQVQTENKWSLAVPEISETGCGKDVQPVADVSTTTDTVQMTDSETCWDLSNLRTSSTNTDSVLTLEVASETSVSVKEQSSQIEEEPLETKELSEVGIQASFDLIDMGIGDADVSVVVCDRCSNISQAEVSVSVSESDLCQRRTIGTNHSVATRSVGTGSFTIVENKYFIEDSGGDQMCNVCRGKVDQGNFASRVSVGVGGDFASRVSVGVGGETTMEKQVYSAGENLGRPPFHLDSSPTNRSFPATNPKERRRPRSHSSPTINTAGVLTDQHQSNHPSSMKLTFPDPPDFTRFKWSAPHGTNGRQEADIQRAIGSSNHSGVSEGDDTSALEESTESIFRAEETVFRRNRPEHVEETKELDESPLDPIPKNGIDDIKYSRQTSHESSSAPQSTSHSLSSLASSSDSDGSSSSEGSAFLSTTTEGSYDGHTGKVHVKRKRKISPKKKQKQYVFPQKVPLSPSSFQACQVIEKHVKHSGDSQDKDYVSSLNSILREWFELSSQENSEVEHVQGYLMSLADVSKAVLKKIINMADGNGNTALHYSISHGNFLIVNALLESGVCEVNKPNKAGATAIMLTALASIHEERDWRTVEKLFKNGDVNIRASQAGQTALMLAVSRGKVRMVQLLLQAGADVNVQDEDGSTALMCASEHGHLDIVKLLIAQQGCDININDNDGCNAFSIAMENNHKAIGVLLYAHMNFGKQSSPKKWITSGSPSTRTILNSSLNISSSHTSAFTPVSKSLTQDAPPPPSSEDPPKHPSRSRSLSPTSRQSSLLSSRKSKYQNPPKGSHSTATGGPSNPKSSVGNSNDFGQSASKPTTPQNNFQRNTPLRRSGPARSKQAESSGIVSALRRSGDPQSKNQSV